MEPNLDKHITVSGSNPAGPGEDSFAALLAKSDFAPERLSPGQRVKAKVVSISGDTVYIDLGGKSEGIIDLAEFRKEDGAVSVSVGDEIEASFVSMQNGVRKLTTLVHGYSAASISSIRGAFEAGLPVTGDVKREVKGGFEVIVGGVRCFCPFSQIDLRGGREGGIYLGRSFPFKVLEFAENGRNIIVSRRALLEEEKQARINALKESLSVGAEVKGTVRAVQNFGAFVDLGGVDGLIPASELSWDRGLRPADVVSNGQEVTAKIISLDWENSRLTLSLKALQPDPWASIADRYPVDSRVTGTIVRLAQFGAFVNLEPGIDGLVHISNLGAGRRINHPKEVVEVGQTVEAYVVAVDTEKRKISLSMRPKVEPKKIVLPQVGEVAEGTVEKVMPFGVFVKLSSGITGLVPNAELGTEKGSDHKRLFAPGSQMKVSVIEVDAATAKVRLSRKAVLDSAVQEEYQQYVDSSKQQESASGGFGTFGDLLRAKMEEKKTQG